MASGISPRRNIRSKGFKVKHALRIAALVAICVWLVYPVQHSSEETVKLGRKYLNTPVEENTIEDQKQKEDKQEEYQQALEGKQGGDYAMLNRSPEGFGVEGGDLSKLPGSENETGETNGSEVNVKMEGKEEGGDDIRKESDENQNDGGEVKQREENAQNQSGENEGGQEETQVGGESELDKEGGGVEENKEKELNEEKQESNDNAGEVTNEPREEDSPNPTTAEMVEANANQQKNNGSITYLAQNQNESVENADPKDDNSQSGLKKENEQKETVPNEKFSAPNPTPSTTENAGENSYADSHGVPSSSLNNIDSDISEKQNGRKNMAPRASDGFANQNDNVVQNMESNASPGMEAAEKDTTSNGTGNAYENQSESNSNPGKEAGEKDTTTGGTKSADGNQSEPTSSSPSFEPQDEKEASLQDNGVANSTTHDSVDSSDSSTENAGENSYADSHGVPSSSLNNIDSDISEKQNGRKNTAPRASDGFVSLITNQNDNVVQNMESNTSTGMEAPEKDTTSNETGNAYENQSQSNSNPGKDAGEKDTTTGGTKSADGNQSEPTSSSPSLEPQDEKEASLQDNGVANSTTHDSVDSSDSSIRHDETNAHTSPGSLVGDKREGNNNDAAVAE